MAQLLKGPSRTTNISRAASRWPFTRLAPPRWRLCASRGDRPIRQSPALQPGQLRSLSPPSPGRQGPQGPRVGPLIPLSWGLVGRREARVPRYTQSRNADRQIRPPSPEWEAGSVLGPGVGGAVRCSSRSSSPVLVPHHPSPQVPPFPSRLSHHPCLLTPPSPQFLCARWSFLTSGKATAEGLPQSSRPRHPPSGPTSWDSPPVATDSHALPRAPSASPHLLPVPSLPPSLPARRAQSSPPPAAHAPPPPPPRAGPGP